MTVLDAEAADLVEVVRLGRQALVLADPATPIQLVLEPATGRQLRLTIRDIDGEQSTTTSQQTTTAGPVTVQVSTRGTKCAQRWVKRRGNR